MSDIEIYRNTLLALLSLGDFIELRLILPNGKIQAFQGKLTEESLEKFLILISKFDKKCQVELTLNPLTPATSNRDYAGNKNVAHRRYILIDVDAITQDGVVTDERKTKCYEIALQIRQYLMDIGFCKPLLADSGNNYHLVYHVENLPNSTISTHLIRSFLNALNTRFATKHVTVDKGTANAGRFMKVYGTHSQKEPFRQSKILEIPDDWRKAVVTTEQLESVISKNTIEKIYTLNSVKKIKPSEILLQELQAVLKLLEKQGVTVQQVQDLADGEKKFTLKGCPFEKPSSTRQTACLYLNNNGKITLTCLHDACYDLDLQTFLLNQINLKK